MRRWADAMHGMVILIACAWVLWTNIAGPGIGEGPWQSQGGYDTRDACQESGEKLWTQMKKPKGMLLSFQCLPDTVDPRAPK